MPENENLLPSATFSSVFGFFDNPEMIRAEPVGRRHIPEGERVGRTEVAISPVIVPAGENGLLRDADAVKAASRIGREVNRTEDGAASAVRQEEERLLDMLHGKQVFPRMDDNEAAVLIRLQEDVVFLERELVLVTPLDPRGAVSIPLPDGV